jgi:NAD(P)-dependent dehydrogenase (short-subunit alcohol dehydrogenase family)
MSSWPVNGKVVLITGAARGIGAAGARELARRGASLALADLDGAALKETAGVMGTDPLTIELDVTDTDACEGAVNQVVERYGHLDVVWANAGIGTAGPIHLTDATAWKRTIEVNLIGAYNTVRAAVPRVIQTKGYIAVTASMASFAHPPHMSAYSASKAAAEAMCNSARMEMAHRGVAVGSIHPTWIDTDMVREADEMPGFNILRRAQRGPLKKTFSAEKAAQVIVNGFEKRSRRICVPEYMRLVQALRPLLTTSLFERDQLPVVPEMEKAFIEAQDERGALAASASERVAVQMRR